MILSTLQKKLTDLGFEAILSDSTIQAVKETGNVAWEITVDSGGEVLLVKKSRMPSKTSNIKFKGKVVPIVSENLNIESFRVHIDSSADFSEIEKILKEA